MPKKEVVNVQEEVTNDKPKVKRGRRTKKEIEEAKALLEMQKSMTDGSENVVISTEESTKPPPKKRGRKPKGGKIITKKEEKAPPVNTKPNVILHLKCFIKDLLSEGHHEPDFSKANVNSYDQHKLPYHMLTNSVDDHSTYQQLLTETDNNIIDDSIVFQLSLIHI